MRVGRFVGGSHTFVGLCQLFASLPNCRFADDLGTLGDRARLPRIDEAWRSEMPMEMPTAIGRYVDAFNAGDFETVLEQFTPDAIIHGVLGSFPVQQAEPIWRELNRSMALELIPQDVVVDGSGAAVRYIERGRFRAPFRGLPGHAPTNRPYEITAIEWFEMQGSKIHRRWGARDSASISKQVLG
jgi:hypothetical protein